MLPAPGIVKIIRSYTPLQGNLNVIPDARVRNIISKGYKHRFPPNIDFRKCRREKV